MGKPAESVKSENKFDLTFLISVAVGIGAFMLAKKHVPGLVDKAKAALPSGK